MRCLALWGYSMVYIGRNVATCSKNPQSSPVICVPCTQCVRCAKRHQREERECFWSREQNEIQVKKEKIKQSQTTAQNGEDNNK